MHNISSKAPLWTSKKNQGKRAAHRDSFTWLGSRECTPQTICRVRIRIHTSKWSEKVWNALSHRGSLSHPGYAPSISRAICQPEWSPLPHRIKLVVSAHSPVSILGARACTRHVFRTSPTLRAFLAVTLALKSETPATSSSFLLTIVCEMASGAFEDWYTPAELCDDLLPEQVNRAAASAPWFNNFGSSYALLTELRAHPRYDAASWAAAKAAATITPPTRTNSTSTSSSKTVPESGPPITAKRESSLIRVRTHLTRSLLADRTATSTDDGIVYPRTSLFYQCFGIGQASKTRSSRTADRPAPACLPRLSRFSLVRQEAVAHFTQDPRKASQEATDWALPCVA